MGRKTKKFKVEFDVELKPSVDQELPEEVYLQGMISMEFGHQDIEAGKISNIKIEEKI